MLPLYLLTNAKGQQMVIELKNGETIAGQLVNVDNWMNLTLSKVTHTSANDCVKLPEMYVRGSFVKYIKLQDDLIEKVKQNSAQQQSQGHSQGKDFRRRQGGRKDGEKRFNAGNNSRRGDSREFYHGNNNSSGGRRFNNSQSNNFNSRAGEDRSMTSNHSSAMGGFVKHHQTSSSQQPLNLGGQTI
ncbi:LAFA_0D05270g1_1 [Lachancea sp. 'fantastica']|nr:LAFA_0D05270g1_1 [Lachancea sp. 'fantastica']